MISAYVVSFIVILIVALLPSRVMVATQSPWYECVRPSVAPPNYVFPIAWSILYVLIAIALAQILHMQSSVTKTTLVMWLSVNLVLNVLWSFVFFGVRRVRWAFIVLLGIIVSLVAIFVVGWTGGVNKGVLALLVPYGAWLLFALVLNGQAWPKETICSTRNK